MDGTSFEKKLERFGLSEKEIETYKTILKYGEVKASVASKEADVSNRYVYSLSEALEDRNLIEIADHESPTVFRAKPPEEVSQYLIDESQLLESEIEERYAYNSFSTKDFNIIKSRRTVIKQFREMISEAEEEVILSLPVNAYEELADVLRDARERGLLTLLLLTDVEIDESVVEEVQSVANVLRTWDAETMALLTTDDEFGLCCPYDLMQSNSTDSRAIGVGNYHMMSFMHGTFIANYWPMGTEQFVAEPSPLPRTYTCFRHAILDGMVYMQNGTSLQITSKAKPRHSEEDFDEISGEVTNVYQNLIEPVNNGVPLQITFEVDAGDEEITIGGPGAFMEDYESEEVTLDLLEQ